MRLPRELLSGRYGDGAEALPLLDVIGNEFAALREAAGIALAQLDVLWGSRSANVEILPDGRPQPPPLTEDVAVTDSGERVPDRD